jgi:CBS domain-containing protein
MKGDRVMSSVQMILERKGKAVSSIEAGSDVLAAARMMNELQGGLMVMQGTEIRGIVTERDILGKVVAAGEDPETTRVSDIMTGHLQTYHPTR